MPVFQGSGNMPDAEQQELLLAFVEEGNELLDETEPLLIELESRANESGEIDYEILNMIFRLFHSLKGGSSFLDLLTVQGVTHEAETLLDLFRKCSREIHRETIDLLTRTCDFLRQLLGNIQSHFTDEGFDDEAEKIIIALKAQIAAISGEGDSGQEATPMATDSKRRKTVRGDGEKAGIPTPDALTQNDVPETFHFAITPEIVKQFVAESEDLLSSAEESFLRLDKMPDDMEHIDEAFRALHSFKGNAGFLGYEDLEKLSHQAETILDKIRTQELESSKEIFSLLLNVLDCLRTGISQVAGGKEIVLPAAKTAIAAMHSVLKAISPSAQSPVDKQLVAEQSKEKHGQQKMTSGTMETDETGAAEATSEPIALPGLKSSGAQQTGAERHSIRVDVEKLGALLELVGELVIAEAMVAQNPDLRNVKTSLDNFEKASLHLNKITRDLQDISTSIRMIPLSGTFRRMIRLVRDLAQKTGKKVDLIITGENTEVDKTVIEQIADPLVHLIRNAIDHGLSTPEKRKTFGKSETGQLVLGAKHVGGEVWISIIDDGQGLSREMILRNAVARDLVKGSGAELTNDEVWRLVFEPGFSTAEQVTDVSGRGVGLDVVKRNIENIRGKIDIVSKPGKGTEVILRIPLTLAIIDGMIIRVGSSRYIIPIISIVETLRPNFQEITVTMDGHEILNVRGNLCPVVRLHEFYNLEPSSTELTEGIVILVENAGKRFGLFVDELVGQQQVVIKGLSEFVGNIKAISGCTIMGDGRVCLIVDIAALADLFFNGYQTEAALPEPLEEKM